MKQFDYPDEVAAVLERLRSGGYEAYLVGGCVRDFLSGIRAKDHDIATSAKPEEIKGVFHDYTVIETGIKHGTVTVLSGGSPVEVTTFRTDGEYPDKRRPSEVSFTDSVVEDLSRRDFTVNAIAYSPESGLIDPFGGVDDLKSKIIRAVGDPEKRFSEDPLRILRGMRFASVTGFEVEDYTAKSMISSGHLLNFVSAERIGKEFTDMICGKAVEDVLLRFRDIVSVIIPELNDSFDHDQMNPHHCYDIYTHSVRTAAAVPAEPVLRLAGLLHDIGKPETFSVGADGVGHFYGHAKISAEITEKVCLRLKLNSFSVRMVTELVRRHDYMIEPEMKYIRRAVSKFGEDLFLKLMELKRADGLAADPGDRTKQELTTKLISLYEQMVEEDLCFKIGDLAINGDDLIATGIPEGPRIGRLLDACLQAVISDELQNTHDVLISYAIIENQKNI